MAHLTLRNKTAWSSRDLRGLILAGLAAEGDGRRYTVTVTYTRGFADGCSGYAYYNTGTIRMRVPSPMALGGAGVRPDILPLSVVTDFAGVLVHEILHTYGVRHREMHGAHKRGSCAKSGVDHTPWAAPWITGERLISAPTHAPVAPEEREAGREATIRSRYESAQRRVARLTTKAKRIATALKKAKASVVRYERTYGGEGLPGLSDVRAQRKAASAARPAAEPKPFLREDGRFCLDIPLLALAAYARDGDDCLTWDGEVVVPAERMTRVRRGRGVVARAWVSVEEAKTLRTMLEPCYLGQPDEDRACRTFVDRAAKAIAKAEGGVR